MKLTQLAAKPQLIKISLEDEETISQYGEPLDFWVYDRQPIDKFVKLATLKSENTAELIGVVNEMILDEDGTAVIKEGVVLPMDVMTKVIGKVVERLGK